VPRILAKSGSAGGVIWPSSAPSVGGDDAVLQWTSQYGLPRQMTHAAVTVAAVALAATTGHRRHGLIGLVVLLILIAGVAYYFWRRRSMRRQRGDEQH
jgi:uncharacterized membrane protein YdjX (TVP38/TMEM64 family)